MRIKTLVIAPYQGLMELTNSLLPELTDFDCTVVLGDLSEAVSLIEKHGNQGYELIISRGGTAKRIGKHTSLPVVEIQVSGYDIIRMLTLVKDYKADFEIIGFPNVIDGVVAISSLMDIRIPHTVIHGEEEVDAALAEAKEKGVMVVIGDTITVTKAKEKGMQGILITSGREAVLEAFSQARYLHRTIARCRSESAGYVHLVNRMKSGAAIIDDRGIVQFANERFYRQLNLSAREVSSQSLYAKLPYLQNMPRQLEQAADPHRSFHMYDASGKYILEGSLIEGETDNRWYTLFVEPTEQADSDLLIGYSDSVGQSFPQLVFTEKEFREVLGGTEPDLSQLLVLYGEKGSGKRLFANMLLEKLGRSVEDLIEIEIVRGSEESYSRLRDALLNAGPEAVLYVKHCERLSGVHQRDLVKVLGKMKASLIVALDRHPRELQASGWLDSVFYNRLEKNMACIPPLRGRNRDLEEYVRAFLSMYNEKYGKQVVGVRPEVMKRLYEHSWEGNLIELRDVIDEFVSAASGEFIETDALALLARRERSGGAEQEAAVSGSRTVNLNRSLEEIEREIVALVLQEEGMNQSKAAKRLGINRTTLWRKLTLP
ncbi:PrpR N-terminal domain-containing protein [Cohnella cellulosilytica]|uniref:PrpR N-terminal domain-containing protein n=1 Tax=Cohnella cellulosilytica TaxID=986710 RepID=A0ABW2F5J0_9BACL